MKKIISISFLILMVAGVFVSCKKYENGPRFSLRTKKARIVNNWKLDVYFRNGVQESLSDNIFRYINWEFTKDEIVNFYENGEKKESGRWELNKQSFGFIYPKNKTEIKILNETFKITRLKEKELWLKLSNDEYRFVPN